ncbi:serine/threonine-protein kinase [Streptomyces sp. NPDC055663]
MDAVEPGGRLAGRYKLATRLGRGGMGEVWRAFDEELKRAVAVKILRDGVTGTEAISRLRREASIGARIRHSGITMVHDIGSDDDRLFIVMELLEGRDLDDLVSDAPAGLPVADAVGLATQIADALAAAHDQGVVHRDLKPANVFLHQGRVKICDFGISRSADSTTGLTSTGLPFGTPLYMAPEQWRGQHVDERCDLYALGCILYAMLTGTPPFAGDYFTLMRLHVDQAPQSPRAIRPEIPHALDSLVLALLAKNPQARPATAHITGTALAGIAHGSYSEGSLDDAIEPGPADTLTARHNLAHWRGVAGDAAGAASAFAELLEARSRVLGPDHADTLTARHNLAHWRGETQ